MERLKFGSTVRDSAVSRSRAIFLALVIAAVSPLEEVVGAEREKSSVFEATELVGEGDSPPTFLSGPTPVLPEAHTTLQPTVVCRLRVDSTGKVVFARVYGRRPALAAFEEAALQSIRAARFLPAQRARKPVSSWLNWPVTFQGHADNKKADDSAALLRIKGSETIGGELGEALAKEFERKHPGVSVRVESKGSSTGFSGLLDGSAEIAASSRPATPDEIKRARAAGIALSEFVLGFDGITVVVHPDNPVRALSLDHVAAIFGGRTRRWNELGGGVGEIHPLGRSAASGTRAYFRDVVLRRGDPERRDDFYPGMISVDNNEEIVDRVAGDRLAVAYIGHGWLQSKVVPVAISGILPDDKAIAEGRYPIHRPLLLYAKSPPDRLPMAFIRMALSPSGQALVTKHGFVASNTPLDAASGAETESHAPLR